MKRRLTILMFVIGFALALTNCVETFDLPVSGSDVNFVVVDGFLNTANGEINVKIMRASLITQAGSPAEVDAKITLEDSEGNSYTLTELDPGQYTGSTSDVEPGRQYRLYIKTQNGKEYRSAFITLKATPEISEISWKALADGTQIIVDTEDATNTTRYYRWTYEETWEYRSRFSSYCSLAVRPDTIIAIPRKPSEMIDVCYRTQQSSWIYTTSTTGLTQDRVNDYELVFLPKGTEKLGYRYSILVKQYAITKETYDYLQKLKNTSQEQGGLFSPQPSRVTGNLYNIADPSETVLGYFNAGVATEKRIFIIPEDLPPALRGIKRSPDFCLLETLTDDDPDTLQIKLRGFVGGDRHLAVDILAEDGSFYGISHAAKACVDCRLKGGRTIKPVFWP